MPHDKDPIEPDTSVMLMASTTAAAIVESHALGPGAAGLTSGSGAGAGFEIRISRRGSPLGSSPPASPLWCPRIAATRVAGEHGLVRKASAPALWTVSRTPGSVWPVRTMTG